MRTPVETQRLEAVYRDYAERRLGSTKWSPRNRGNQAIVAERDRALNGLLTEAGWLPLNGRRVLDIGCGAGGVLAGFQRWGARPEDLHGVDLLEERVRQAQAHFPGLSIQQANAERLPFPEAAFDLVALFTVFSSILSADMKRNVASEVRRVLRPGGGILWYDFRVNNPFNRRVRGISRREIRSCFSGFEPRLRPVTLVPQLARRLGPLTGWLYPVLAGIPVLRTHYTGLLVAADD